MPDTNTEYRRRFLKRQLLFEQRYRDIFDRIADQFAKIANDPNAKFTKAFRFPPSIVRRMNGIITDMHGELLAVTEDEITRMWDLSNEKNDKIVADYLKTITNIKAAQSAAYYMPNIPALKAFISGRHGTETLNDAVWKIARQFRAEMEVHLGLGIVNGTSAQTISQRIRQYLQNPDALFRRVRDASGKLVPSQRMREYHPGQGVYRSAYKNAMRVARSETNMAYHSADTQRWAQLDMVKGIKISLSGSHPTYNFPEICEVCAGIYPKTFDWQGWHPSCLCHAVPILTSRESFNRYLDTGIRERNNYITLYPDSFKYFVKDNFERFSNYSSVPYWFRDNLKVITNIYTEMQ